jgi:hypothetical protein
MDVERDPEGRPLAGFSPVPTAPQPPCGGPWAPCSLPRTVRTWRSCTRHRTPSAGPARITRGQRILATADAAARDEAPASRSPPDRPAPPADALLGAAGDRVAARRGRTGAQHLRDPHDLRGNAGGRPRRVAGGRGARGWSGGGFVLAGVGGSDADVGVLETPFAEADRVVVLHARGGPIRLLGERRAPDVAAAARLAAAVSALALCHPRVGIEMRTPHCGPDGGLLDSARSARLVVAGSRGRHRRPRAARSARTAALCCATAPLRSS